MSKFVGTGPSSYKKRIYRTVVSQRLRITDVSSCCMMLRRWKDTGSTKLHSLGSCLWKRLWTSCFL